MGPEAAELSREQKPLPRSATCRDLDRCASISDVLVAWHFEQMHTRTKATRDVERTDVVIAWIQARNIDISTASTNNYAQK